mgnify:FL=1
MLFAQPVDANVLGGRKNFICTAQQIYFTDAKSKGELYVPPNNYVSGQKFVVDRMTGEAQGSLLDTTAYGWDIIINSTGNRAGDWMPSFTYHGTPTLITESGVLEPQLVRHNKTLTITTPYNGENESYRKDDEGKNITFRLMQGASIVTGNCESL